MISKLMTLINQTHYQTFILSRHKQWANYVRVDWNNSNV